MIIMNLYGFTYSLNFNFINLTLQMLAKKVILNIKENLELTPTKILST